MTVAPIIDTDVLALSGADPLEVCIEMTRDIVDLAPVNWRRPGLDVKTRFWAYGEAALCHTVIGGHAVARRDSMIDGKVPRIALFMNTRGATHRQSEGQSYTLRPGTFHLTDFTRTFCGVSDPVDTFSVYLPHATVGYDPARHPAHMQISQGTPRGRMLAIHMATLTAALPAIPKVAADALIDTLRGILDGPSADQASLRATRRRAIVALVNAHLDDPMLQVDTVAAALGVSRATIYRDLEGLGGFRRLVRQRRLEEVWKELAFGPDRRGVVTEAGQRWHFDSTSHLSREFLLRFGLRPSKVVATAVRHVPDRERVSVGGPGDSLTRWSEAVTRGRRARPAA